VIGNRNRTSGKMATGLKAMRAGQRDSDVSTWNPSATYRDAFRSVLLLLHKCEEFPFSVTTLACRFPCMSPVGAGRKAQNRRIFCNHGQVVASRRVVSGSEKICSPDLLGRRSTLATDSFADRRIAS